MKIYIVDSDRDSRIRLKRMIEDSRMGVVAGMSSGWEDAYLKVREVRPELILTDLVLPGNKAINYTQRVKKILPDTVIIMMTAISNADIVRQAYEKGAEFVLHKPLIDREMENALRHVEMTKTMQWMIGKALNGLPELFVRQSDKTEEESAGEKRCDTSIRRLKRLLQEIGILSEAGSKDIILVIRHLLEQEMDLRDVTVSQLLSQMNQNPKSAEQRIRRAAMAGMVNLAGMGMEDDADPAFLEYAGRLYSMEQIKREISCIRGKSEVHGNVRIRKFLSGILDYCREIYR